MLIAGFNKSQLLDNILTYTTVSGGSQFTEMGVLVIRHGNTAVSLMSSWVFGRTAATRLLGCLVSHNKTKI